MTKPCPLNPKSHSVAVSLTDEHSPDTVPADRPTMLIANGLFAFLSEPVIAGIFRRITEHFGTGEIAFNDYGGIGWLSRAALINSSRRRCSRTSEAGWGYAGFKDAHHPQTWNPRIVLIEEASLTAAPEVDLFPGWLRVSSKLMGKTKCGRSQGAHPALRVLGG